MGLETSQILMEMLAENCRFFGLSYSSVPIGEIIKQTAISLVATNRRIISI